MSLLHNVLSLATSAFGGKYTNIARKAQDAIKQGVKPDSPIAREVAMMVLKQFPQLRGKANIVQAIDDMIPDSVQSKFGFTPPVMQFIKQAVGSSVSANPAVSAQK